MPDDRRFFPEPDHDLDGTQPVEEIDTSKHLPPPPGRSHVQLPSRPQSRREKRKRDQRRSDDARKPAALKQGDRPRDRSRSGLYLPAWSVLLMLVTVFVVAFGIIALVIGLGGGSQPDGSPRIIIITAEPSNTPSEPQAAVTPTRPLLPNQTSQGDIPNFALEGPTLPPVVFSPTPLSIVVGSTVVVNAEGGLNVRAGAGLDQNIMFNANDGEVFEVEDGPTQANGLTWWLLRDPEDSSRFGWAAADYLDVQASQ
jgi:hypothetical protein